jgi:diaminohydroxyphosphoribosylaminopyrimidine deaminase/5-amino-6-(5-phosphoribosylamino)uracil reductase
MKTALKLAAKGAQSVFPNPMVGAVVVKDGRIVGRGWHGYFGGPHAEIHALKEAGPKARGATLYVTLEPCSHWGKTPPCTDTIIRAGITRVVAASNDPNPKASGKGFSALRAKGIGITAGILKKQAHELNAAYYGRFRGAGRRVIVKAAMSLDGKICTRTGDSKWISSKRSRKLVHKLRSRVDAIVVGVSTIIKDDPELTSHGLGRDPLRVIIDPQLRIPLKSKVLSGAAPKIIFTASTKPKAKLEALKQRSAIVKFLGKGVRFDFKRVIKELAIMSIYSVLIEGGGETIASAIESGAVDEIMLFISPIIVGGRDAKTPVEGTGVPMISLSRRITNMRVSRIGPDLMLTGKVN